MPKRKQATLSNREKLLLPLALALMIVVLYGVGRLRPGLAHIERLKKELTTAVQGRENLNWPSLNGADPTQVQNEINQLEAIKEQLQTQLSDQEATLANLRSSSELQSLRIQISTLARHHDLRVIKNVPYGVDEEDSPVEGHSFRLKDAPKSIAKQNAPVIHEFFQLVYARPLQHLELAATYGALQQFIHSLDLLPFRVNVIAFELKMDEQTDPLLQPQLKTRLILAL